MVKHAADKETLTPTVHRLLQLWENLQTDVFRLIKEQGPTKTEAIRYGGIRSGVCLLPGCADPDGGRGYGHGKGII